MDFISNFTVNNFIIEEPFMKIFTLLIFTVIMSVNKRDLYLKKIEKLFI